MTYTHIHLSTHTHKHTRIHTHTPTPTHTTTHTLTSILSDSEHVRNTNYYSACISIIAFTQSTTHITTTLSL